MAITREAGVTAAQGFAAAGIAAGIKDGNKKDMALVVNTGDDLTAAGVFTTNKFQAAPVAWSRDVLARHTVRAVVLNSGGANACTGTQGLADAAQEATALSEALSGQGFPTQQNQIAVCSTGVIGDLLPMDKILAGIRQLPTQLGSSATHGKDAAAAIMTTDTVAKYSEMTTDNGWTVGGW